MAIIIKPRVKGSFKNFVLMKAKAADKMVRIVMMAKMSINAELEVKLQNNWFQQSCQSQSLKCRLIIHYEVVNGLWKYSVGKAIDQPTAIHI